eukprot:3793727-Karenia_brevis.AAC.1
MDMSICCKVAFFSLGTDVKFRWILDQEGCLDQDVFQTKIGVRSGSDFMLDRDACWTKMHAGSRW